MRLLALIFIPLLTCSAFAKAEHFCMSRHIHEAMLLNQERKPQYAALTGGKSIPVSETLMDYEKALIIQSRLADLVALPFQWTGSSIMCAEFVSMSETPPFRTHYEVGAPNIMNFHPASWREIGTSLQGAVKNNDFQMVKTIADRQIVELEKEPRFNCMMRHFLESIRRIAGLAPSYKYGTFISKRLLLGHLNDFELVAEIDQRAAPVQASGVPIICQDVPHIPPAP
jgi:hypothetical protein